MLDAFNKDRASLPTPAPPPQVAAVPPPPPPDARTQEMINEKLKKAEELGMGCNLLNGLLSKVSCIVVLFLIGSHVFSNLG